MNKPMLGLTVGAALGFLDGCSAWFYPEARSMMVAIVIGSTVKGVVTGLIAGFIARWRRSMGLGVTAGLLVGFVLSSLAAIGQTDHYVQIVLPGMLVGAIVGFVTQRYPDPKVLIVVLLAVTTAGMSAQSPAPTDSLAPVVRLVGRWTGTVEGQPGAGTVEREYQRVLGSRFIQVRNRSTYPPQPKNPKGEAHEDIGFLSFDSARKRVVLRQFHSEGFVNQYVLELATTADRLVFVSESIENIPPGFRARETYVFSDADRFEETFDIAEPGKDFELYSRSRFTRAR